MISDQTIYKYKITTNTNLFIDSYLLKFTTNRDYSRTANIEMKSFLVYCLAGSLPYGHQNLNDLLGSDGFGIECYYELQWARGAFHFYFRVLYSIIFLTDQEVAY